MQKDLIKEISQVLLSEQANFPQICRQIGTELGLPPAKATNTLYEIVKQLNAEFFPPLTQMEMILTEACNLSCAYCFEKDMIKHKKMSAKTARSAVDLLFDYSQKETDLSITHFGGEPLLNFPMVQYITEYAEKKAKLLGKSIYFGMTSNGLLLDEHKAEYLAKHKINVLLSIDGCELTHNRYRVDKRGMGTFKRTIKGMSVLKKVQPWIGSKMTVMPENVTNLLEDVIGLYGMGINQFLIGHATGVKWSREDMDEYGRQLREVAKWYKQEPRQDLRIAEFDEINKATNYFGCRAGRNSVSVSANGEISSCSKVLSLNNNQLIARLGDVKYGLTHFRNREELISCSKLRSACEAKEIAKDFRGGCFASNYEENGNPFQPSVQEYEISSIEQSVCSEFAS
jgi:uncharacterized protein